MAVTTPEFQEMVQSIVATPSVSSTMPQFDQSNQAMVDLLANWLAPLGFDIQLQPIPEYPGKVNLIATLGKGRDGLLLSGHTDTVPFDADLWQSDPFLLKTEGERWYGLGVCDMKSFFAMCIAAVDGIDPRKLKHPIVILGTADEESCMSGARALTLEGLSFPKFALIGEPTGLVPINKHKSIAMLGLRIRGSSGHSSNPALGNNALDVTGPVLMELCKFRDDMATSYQDTSFEVAVPTLNLGCIHGGDNPNRICDHVDLSFDLRLLPGMNDLAIVDAIADRIRPMIEKQGLEMEIAPLHPPIPAFSNNRDNLIKACIEASGHQAETVAFATEAPFLEALGIETVVMGAGSIDQAHQPNEFLDVAQIDPSIAIIRALIQKYCL
tara:strand:- start:1983 stop:3131 length:1149 start_codon:yes stop_codon:yes gene_type:complete